MFQTFVLLFFSLLFVPTLYAQNEVDALRQAQRGNGIGARALAIGPAYSAISDDYAAVFFNPAGLGQIKRFEATLGFDFFDYSTNALYLNTSNAAAKSGNTLNSIGLVLPFPTYQGSFVVAVGYNRLQNFRAVQNVSAFNPSGSISDWFLSFTPRFDAQQRILLTDVGALAFNHYLMSDRNGQYVDPLINRGQVFQRSDLLEDGGSNAFSISAAIEVAPALFIGATLNIISSYYTFSRDFSEHDDNNVYPNFISLTLSESFETRTSGANLKAGLLYRPDSHWRLGLTLQIPSQLSLKDEFNTSLQTRYERPPEGATHAVFNDALPKGALEYQLQTPWIFGASFSFEESFFTLGAEVSYRDWTQLSYSSDAVSFTDINRTIASELKGAFGLALGLELRPSFLPMRLRAGYGLEQSAFQYRLSDNPNERISTSLADARQTLSFGAGFLFQQTLALDMAYFFSTQPVQGRLYSGSRLVNENVRNGHLVITASFRF
jgi:long-subunit fatty acid transport protein